MAKKSRKAEPDLNIPMRVIVYFEGGWWFAHCLELDIVAEGTEPLKASADVLELSATQVRTALEEGDRTSILRPAPREIWRLFWSAQKKSPPAGLKPQHPINSVEMRELALV